MSNPVDANKQKAAASGAPTKKIKQRLEEDPSLKGILGAVVGSKTNKFLDGLLYVSTVQALNTLFTKFDFVKDGVLRQRDFSSARGIDPIWADLLDTCDFDGHGNITPVEFVAGFVAAAMDKKIGMRLPPSGTVTGFEVMQSLQTIINAHVMSEVQILKKRMGW